MASDIKLESTMIVFTSVFEKQAGQKQHCYPHYVCIVFSEYSYP